MSSWAAAEDSDSDEEVQQPVVSAPAVTESAPVRSTRPSKPAAPRECIGFMMGVRYSARLEDIEEFLRDNEVDFVRIDMISDREGRFSGKAKVELVDDNAFNRFLDLKGATFMDKEILTKEWEAERPRRDDRRDDRRGGGRGDDRREPREPREYAPRPAPAHGDARRFDNGDRQDRREAPRDRDFGDRDRRRPNNSSQVPRDRDDRRPRRDGDEEAAPAAPAAPAERRRVVLAPRTKPIEEIGQPAARPDIFGGGRPHDELEFQRRKEQEKATSSSADAGDNATGGYTITPPADDNKKPAARKEDRAPRKEKEPRREKKEKKDRAPSTVDQDGALAAQLAAEEIGKLTVQSPDDADFTVVERSSKKKAGPPATAAGGAASSGASKKPIQNNSKGKGNGPPRQEQKPASAKGDGKKDKVGAKKEAAASAAPPSSAPAAAAAPSPKLSNTAFASLADDSDQDD